MSAHVGSLPLQQRVLLDPLGPGFINRQHRWNDIPMIEQSVQKLPLRVGKGQYHGEGVTTLIDQAPRSGVRLPDSACVVVP